jgi:hypothetical protein
VTASGADLPSVDRLARARLIWKGQKDLEITSGRAQKYEEGNKNPCAKQPRCSWLEPGSRKAGNDSLGRPEISPLRRPPPERGCWTPATGVAANDQH